MTSHSYHIFRKHVNPFHFQRILYYLTDFQVISGNKYVYFALGKIMVPPHLFAIRIILLSVSGDIYSDSENKHYTKCFVRLTYEIYTTL